MYMSRSRLPRWLTPSVMFSSGTRCTVWFLRSTRKNRLPSQAALWLISHCAWAPVSTSSSPSGRRGVVLTVRGAPVGQELLGHDLDAGAPHVSGADFQAPADQGVDGGHGPAHLTDVVEVAQREAVGSVGDAQQRLPAHVLQGELRGAEFSCFLELGEQRLVLDLQCLDQGGSLLGVHLLDGPQGLRAIRN